MEIASLSTLDTTEGTSCDLLQVESLGSLRTQNTPQNTIQNLPKKVWTLGYLGVGTEPDAGNLPEIIGSINGYPARILLDLGCSIYILSEEFATQNNISTFRMTPIPIDLAVRSRPQL
jgi:hypothetical protein